jgi:hypothetical protein
MKAETLAFTQALIALFRTDFKRLEAFLDEWGSRNRYVASWKSDHRVVREVIQWIPEYQRLSESAR